MGLSPQLLSWQGLWQEEQPQLRPGREWAPELRGGPELLERLRARLLLRLQGTGLPPLAGLAGAPELLAGAVAAAPEQALPRSRKPWEKLLPAWGWC